MRARDYRDLDVWQRAMDLAVHCHSFASRLPRHEQYGLANQLRRAGVSIAANIAEGNGRLHRGDYIYHVSIARGSLAEVVTLLEVACRLGYLPEDDLITVHDLIDHISRMLLRLTRRLRS